jgi:hypothetical protein
VNPLSDFATEVRGEATVLTFRDLLLDGRGISPATPAEYSYEIKTKNHKSRKAETNHPRIVLERSLFEEWINPEESGSIEITIWTTRKGTRSEPVKVHLIRSGQKLEVERIARG